MMSHNGEESEMTGGGAAKKILIVDDEAAVVSYLEMLLQDQGYDTISAGDGEAGLQVARRERPDLLVLDISMPKASGTRLYKELRTDPALAATPVVIVTAVTGYAGDPRGYEKFLSGRKLVPPPDGFFSKPIEREAFLARVAELLQAAAVN
jgi:twitching motility two-component system response regulator PilH